MMTRFALSATFLATLTFAIATPVSASAGSQVGTLTRVEGHVILLSNPSKTITGQGPHVRYEGEYYRYRKANEGDRVEFGNVLRTSVGAQAKVVYDNGDQFSVGDGTEFKVKWNRSPAAADSAAPEMKLLHGKVRAIISKDGPRNRLKIRTKSATMGVRGTDFFISSRKAGKALDIAVIRGAVELQPKAARAKAVKIEKGQTAALAVATETKAAAAPKIRLEQTTKEELAYIQNASAVSEGRRRNLASRDSKTAAKIEMLEKKAFDNTLKDIKTHDPELYAKLDVSAARKAEDLNAVVVTKAIETAPVAPENRKAFGIDLDDSDDVYKKYFNMD